MQEYFFAKIKKNGSSISERFGYLYSWCIEKGSINDMLERRIKNLKLLSTPPNHIPVLIVTGYPVIFKKNEIRIGCRTIKNSIVKEIANRIK